MKKISFLAAAAAAMVMVSCGGGKTAQDTETRDSLISFEQSQIEQKIMVELDSVASLWTKLNPVEGIFENGKIQLSEDELKVKPDYLLDLSCVNDLSLLSQKYRALGMLIVDKKVAKLYNMDEEGYKSALTKLATDVNDPAIQLMANPTPEDVQKFYDEERENGRINFFWEASAAAIMENLYVIVQNTEKFLPALDDQAASDLTYHIALLKISLDDLAAYDENIRNLDTILAPLDELNAISVAQLAQQLETMKSQIEAARGELLK